MAQETITITAQVSRSSELKKGSWFGFQYSETITVPKRDADKERKKLWQKCIDEVDDQIVELKKFLRID